MCERLRNLWPSCNASNFNNESKTFCHKAIYIWSVANVRRPSGIFGKPSKFQTHALRFLLLFVPPQLPICQEPRSNTLQLAGLSRLLWWWSSQNLAASARCISESPVELCSQMDLAALHPFKESHRSHYIGALYIPIHKSKWTTVILILSSWRLMHHLHASLDQWFCYQQPSNLAIWTHQIQPRCMVSVHVPWLKGKSKEAQASHHDHVIIFITVLCTEARVYH